MLFTGRCCATTLILQKSAQYRDATIKVCAGLWMASSVSKAIPPASLDLEIPHTPSICAQPAHPTDFPVSAFKGIDAPQTAQFCLRSEVLMC